MVAVADDIDRDAPSSPQIESLLQIVEVYRRDNAALSARVRELEAKSADDDALKPLKSLVDDVATYERARRACESGRLEATRHGKRWLSCQKWIAEWLRVTGH
jgi:hypothetical protein